MTGGIVLHAAIVWGVVHASFCAIFSPERSSFREEKMAVRFRFDVERTVAAVVYLASKHIDALDKYKFAKLLFLADKFHLVRYGRPITGDEYFALPYGPVPSATLNLLSGEEAGTRTALSGLLELDRRFARPRYSRRSEIPFQFDVLSKSDLNALDETVRRYGSKTFDELKAITHEMPAYANAWNRKSDGDKRARMNFEEFFEEDSDAMGGVSELMEEDAEFF